CPLTSRTACLNISKASTSFLIRRFLWLSSARSREGAGEVELSRTGSLHFAARGRWDRSEANYQDVSARKTKLVVEPTLHFVSQPVPLRRARFTDDDQALSRRSRH